MPVDNLQKNRRSAARRGATCVMLFALAVLVDPAPPGLAQAAAACAPAPDYLSTAELHEGDAPAGAPQPLAAIAPGGSGGSGGIGGTGRSTGGADGAGGVGGIGGTGIVGTITGFASVCVNGVEVHYDDAVPVSENGRALSAAALAIGQVVALDAAPGRLGLTARKIEVVHALEGPVTRNGAGRLEVMGAPVLPADPRVRQGVAALRAGDWVQVSGHRDDAGQWLATRVAQIAPRQEVSLQGTLEQGGRFAGVRLEAADGVAVGATQWVRGEWLPERLPGRDATEDSGRVRVRDARTSPAAMIVERAERVIVETRIREVHEGRARSGHPEIDAALTGSDLRAGELVRVRAHRGSDRRILADRLERQSQRDASSGRGRADRGGAEAERERERDVRDDTRRDASGRSREGEGLRDGDAPERAPRDERKGSDRGPDAEGRVERSERSARLERTDRAERPERVDRDERIRD